MAKASKSKRKPACANNGKQKSFPASSRKPSAKHKSKKATSLFGPISTQQPRSMKWNLTDSMGGSSKKASSNCKNSGRKRTNTKRRPSAAAGQPEQPQKTKPWTLNMPIVSNSDQVVPWLMTEKKINASVKRDKLPSNKLRKIHHGLSLPVASLMNLNSELRCFADYVRLNESEIASRQSVVELIQNYCRHLFGISPDSCKVFGSFACLPVCNFISDVDMAIHDVIHSPQNPQDKPTTIQAATVNGDEDDDDRTPKRATKRVKVEQLHSNPNSRRQDRVMAWKKALDEAEKSGNDNELKLLDTKVTPEAVVSCLDDHKQPSAANDSVGSLSPTVVPMRTEFGQFLHDAPMPVPGNDGLPLFVIDKEGYSDPEERPIQGKARDTDAPTVTDTSKDPSTMSDDEAQNGKGRCFIGSASYGQTFDASSRMHAKHNESGCYQIYSDEENQSHLQDESDVDSADVLAPLRSSCLKRSFRINPSAARAQGNGLQGRKSDEDDSSENEEEPLLNDKARSRSQSVISLCSATTCSDTEEKEWDDSGMEVSFVSHGCPARKLAATVAPSWNDETRAKVIRALNCLSRRLRGNSLANNVHVRKKAKVPIINMETRFGYECDIAIGGHNGTDTSSFASSQCSKFRSFADVVLLLKILLNQHGLDKPFTGGIGSFKLYVLVASHIEQHLELGGEDEAAEILISFLFRYGSIPETGSRSPDSTLRSPLTENAIVTAQGTGREKVAADMGSVFQLENCIKLFQACYFILRRKLQKPSNDPSHSLLGYIIDAPSLKQQRQDCHQRIPHSRVQRRDSSLSIATFPPGLPLTLNSRANTRPRFLQSTQQKNLFILGELTTEAHKGGRSKRKVSRLDCVEEAPMSSRATDIVVLDTDDEAEQLQVGYGIFGSETSGPKLAKFAAKKRRRKEKR